MAISKTTFTILLISVFVGLVVMTVAFFVTKAKINNYKKTVVSKQLHLGNMEKVWNRAAAGELLWNLRETVASPLEDSQLEFLINTALRNDFKTFHIIGSKSSYETKTLVKIAKLKQVKASPDLLVIFESAYKQEFDKAYKKLKPKQMIALVNANQKQRSTRNFLQALVRAQIKHDYIHIGIGLILVVK